MDIHADRVGITIDHRSVIKDQTVHARAGEALALVGPSGSGKTTLLNVMGLLRKPEFGSVTVGDADTARWKDGQRRRFWQRHAAFIFQDYGLIDEESVGYNVALSALAPFTHRARKHEWAVSAALERVGLDGRAREKVSRLSGGEKQRVGLARAIFRGADVILADEPTASLDAANRELVTTFLLAEASRGATVVIATHDEDLVSNCHRIHHLGARKADNQRVH
ncbi:ABC transporter ATP-binding protein [Sinomonas cyclohexanicum]|uniref:ABC transporter ATP-binding protein n=1 Tax=Sinomonas cyclohexanicum TaxID=322009 RepID=A0ABM7Q0L0_SINCY|nr:ATP-binding cassette domain-containing protein [Corynebacterium cyclohexanicum]BCT78103.1 ABC transporter ATP-binding protein [Corynebacterium cyclohexanicum]